MSLTDEQIQAEVGTLPKGIYRDNARASIALLMKMDGLNLNDAIIRFERLVSSGGDAYARAAKRKGKRGFVQ